MLWIDDVLDDLQKFSAEQGYSEIEKMIEETRMVYYAELKDSYSIELPPKTDSTPKPRFPSRFSEEAREFQKGLRLLHLKS